MSDENPSTLSIEDEIPELTEELDSTLQKDAAAPAPVKLVSLTPLFPDIYLTERKTILGRNSKLCSEGAVLDAATISGKHCEITSRSMNEAEAAIWIRDLSSNGVWVNNKKIAKDEPVKIYHRDTIGFKAGATNSKGDTPAYMLIDIRNTKRLNTEIDPESTSVSESPSNSKKMKPNENNEEDEDNQQDSLFEKEFECGICHDIMHKALALQPCLHSFCKDCCKMWFRTSTECPACRQKVERTKQDFKLNNLIALFLKSRPQLGRSDADDDGAESDTSNVIGNNRNNNDDDDEDSDDDDEDDDDIHNNLQFRLNGLPSTCPCCDPTNITGYVCPAGFRLEPLPNQPTFDEYSARRRVQPGHIQCAHCQTHLPDIPLDTQPSIMNLFRCSMCYIPSCGCRTESVDDKIERNSPITGFLNIHEDRIILNYLATENLTTRSVWQEIKDGMDNDTFQYLPPRAPNPRVRSSTITSGNKLCQDCARHFFSNGPLYQWRKNLDPTKLPQNVTSRTHCWYGRECRTQYNSLNPSHAQRLNHICEPVNRPA